jgi:hypothetical protein
MRHLFSRLCITGQTLIGLTIGSFAAEEEQKVTLEKLVYSMSPAPSDVVREGPRTNNPATFTDALTKFPNINDKLLNLVEQDFYTLRNSERLRLSLYALSYTKDLTKEQQERLKLIAQKFSSVGEDDQMERQFLTGLFNVLSNYPSVENEDLALKFAVSDDLMIAINAVMALANIGTARSLALVNSVVKKQRDVVGERRGYLLEKLEEAELTLNKRLGMSPESSAKGSIQVAPSHDLDLKPSAQPTPMALSREPDLSLPHIIWGIVIVAALGLLWLLLKRRS